jgi:membrane protein
MDGRVAWKFPGCRCGAFFTGILPIPEFVMHAVLFVVSLFVIAGVFAVLFKYLPDVDVQLHDVFIGALFTSLLFTIGKFAIGMYLAKRASDRRTVRPDLW